MTRLNLVLWFEFASLDGTVKKNQRLFLLSLKLNEQLKASQLEQSKNQFFFLSFSSL